MAAEPFLEVVRGLPHKLRVMRLYRYGLKELVNWSANRHHWFPRAQALRMEFESNRNLVNREEIRKVVEHGEDIVSRFRHWEPVVKPEAPGGTAYSINPAHPYDVKVLVNYDLLDANKKGDWM